MNISRPWSQEEDAYLLAHYQNLPTMEVSRALNRWHGNVSARAHKLGLISAKQAARATIKHDYFQVIDSPVKAYVLGWLASDGWVASNKNEVGIKLHSKDSESLAFIRNELAPLHELRPRAGSTLELRIYSAQMKTDLIRLGVTPRKSLILPYPNIPEIFDNSFILGCFDGDGSLGLYRKRYYRWQLVSGSKSFLTEVQEKILQGTGIHLGGPIRQGRTTNTWVVYTQCSHVSAVDAWLHADLPGLARKRLPGNTSRHGGVDIDTDAR